MAFPPIVLLADSQLLFLRADDGSRVLEQLMGLGGGPIRRVAYLGASNGDEPAYFELFQAALDGLEVDACRHVTADPTPDDLAFVAEADLLLLAGGDVDRGLRAFRRSGLAQQIVDGYLRGALLVGVSAGAVQLGTGEEVNGANVAEGSEDGPLTSFRFAPFTIDVHAEPDWVGLRKSVARRGAGARGIGIPAGAGAIFHRDGSLEPLRRGLVELVVADDGTISEAVLVPGEASPAPPPAPVVDRSLN
jgi:peptidase E